MQGDALAAGAKSAQFFGPETLTQKTGRHEVSVKVRAVLFGECTECPRFKAFSAVEFVDHVHNEHMGA